MPDSRSVAPSRPAQDPFGPANDIPDGGQSAFRLLAAAAEVGRPRVATGSWPAPGAAPVPAGQVVPAGRTATLPLHRPTVTGAGAGRRVDHVGGAMLRPAPNAVALSDGTRISFTTVEGVPVLEDA